MLLASETRNLKPGTRNTNLTGDSVTNSKERRTSWPRMNPDQLGRAAGVSRRSFLFWRRRRTQCCCRDVAGYSRDQVCLLQLSPQCSVAVVDHARCAGKFSRKSDPVGDLSQSLHPTLGWHDGEHPVLGAAAHGRKVSGLRDQLRASRMSGALVRRVLFVYVSLPRRRVL